MRFLISNSSFLIKNIHNPDIGGTEGVLFVYFWHKKGGRTVM